MRNLKKILALALSLVMMLSVMSVASAAFTDSADITGNYVEAVNVLTGLGVLKGYEDGSVKPQGDITRAEVAAMIYRVATLDVADKQAGIYSDYGMFTDVASNAWYAGYVGYCANALYIKGYGDGTFGPSDNVTGYQALAMVLRALGYDQNNEFGGDGWELRVASTAQSLGILKNVSTTTLGAAADRELVAEIIFQAMQCEKVKYSLGFNYTNAGVDTMMEKFGASKVTGVVTDTNLYWGTTTLDGKTVYGTDADWTKVGYAAYVWTVKGVAITDVIVTGNELSVTTDGTTVAAMTTSPLDATFVAYTNGTVSYFQNGQAASVTPAIGTKIALVDNDLDGKVDSVVATKYTADVVEGEKKLSTSGVVTVEGYYTAKANIDVDYLANVDALTVGDIITYVVVDGYYYVNSCAVSVAEYETKTTEKLANGSRVVAYTVGGVDYLASAANLSIAALSVAYLNEDIVIALDEYGYIVYAGEYTPASSYLYAIENENTYLLSGTAETLVAYLDGSVEVVDVQGSYTESDARLLGKIWTYAEKNGAYKLGAVAQNKLNDVDYTTKQITIGGVKLNKASVIIDLRDVLAGKASAGTLYTGYTEIPSLVDADIVYMVNAAGYMTYGFLVDGTNASLAKAAYVVFNTETTVVDKTAAGYTYELVDGVLVNGVVETNYVLSQAQKDVIDAHGVGVYTFELKNGALSYTYTSFCEDSVEWTPESSGTLIKDNKDITDDYTPVFLNIADGKVNSWQEWVAKGEYYAYFDNVNKIVYVVGDATVGTAGLLAAGEFASAIEFVNGKAIGYYVANGKVTNVVELDVFAGDYVVYKEEYTRFTGDFDLTGAKKSVVVEIYSGADLLGTVSLADSYFAEGADPITTLSVGIVVKGESSSWISKWTPVAGVVPTNAKIYVDGVLKYDALFAEETHNDAGSVDGAIPLTAASWAALLA